MPGIHRNYRKEYDNYQGQPGQIKNRARRNAARRLMVRNGSASKGDGKDVNHKRPLMKGGGNALSNLAMEPKSVNRRRK